MPALFLSSYVDMGLPGKLRLEEAWRVEGAMQVLEMEFLGSAGKPQSNSKGALSWAVHRQKTAQSNFLPSW